MKNPSIAIHVINNANYLVEHIPPRFGRPTVEKENLEALVVVDLAFDPYRVAKDEFFSSEF
ncbi:hypothetical protein C2U37_21750 [Aeromonas sp. ASNIH1]|nr:hypothetical protein C2U37_21750 [Aeromonas sp. ASNIH1]